MSIKNILIVKLSAIGDVIHALPVSYAIKETFPEARVTWVVEPPAYDLLTGNPYIDKIVLFEKQQFKSFSGFIKNVPQFLAELRTEKFDAVLDLQGLGKSAAIAHFAKAPLKLGCCNMREMSHLVSKPICGPHQHGHIVERYLDVARQLGCAVQKVVFPIVTTAKEEEISVKIMQQAGMNLNSSFVVLAIGANWPNKRWPAQYYAELADYLYGKNIIPVLIGGGAVDAALAAEVTASCEIPPVDLVGKTTLKQLSFILKNATAVVGGDTGTMHLAAALNKPLVMLMGPTDINRNGPFGQQENAIEVARECKHCWKRQCELKRDCLADIKVENVVRKLQTLINL